MAQANDAQIADLAHYFVGEIAPDELPIFQAVSEAYLQLPEADREKPFPRTAALAFGIQETISFLTPVLLHLSNIVVQAIVEATKASAGAATTKTVDEIIRSLRARSAPTEPFLSKAQTDVLVKRLAAQLAREHLADASKARILRLYQTTLKTLTRAS